MINEIEHNKVKIKITIEQNEEYLVLVFFSCWKIFIFDWFTMENLEKRLEALYIQKNKIEEEIEF